MFTFIPGTLDQKKLYDLAFYPQKIQLTNQTKESIRKSEKNVQSLISKPGKIYGINTGLGLLSQYTLTKEELKTFQKNTIFSHACGVGTALSEKVVRLILILKINCLAQAHSGVSLELVERLVWLYNQDILPIIPNQGSVGASGDLAPLAYIGLTLMGIGDVLCQGQILASQDVFKKYHIKPYDFKIKEALSLINGTQVSTAIALYGGFELQQIFSQAIISGALSSCGFKASCQPFNSKVAVLKNSTGVKKVSKVLKKLLYKIPTNDRVQDPYSIRCQPQVMGAIWSYLIDAMKHITHEANAISDNPIWVGELVSNGNFHAEICAFSADLLAIVGAEIGAISERRVALLMDKNLSQLPPFLTKKPGINSGMMLAHVTSSALTSENKIYAHPASIDSLPTSANQEDHVSMAPISGMKLLKLNQNLKYIIAIETLVALQAIDLSQSLNMALNKYYNFIRSEVSFMDEDRRIDKDIEKVLQTINNPIYYNDIFEQFFSFKNIKP